MSEKNGRRKISRPWTKRESSIILDNMSLPELRSELISKIEGLRKKGKIVFSEGGHSIRKPEYITLELDKLKTTALIELDKAISKNRKLKKPQRLEGSCLNRCSVCGEAPEFYLNGVAMYPVEPCKYPEGIPLSFELNIPSGRMIVGNDLRPEFDILGDYDINTSMGCVKTSLAMAKIGCAYAFVGNTSPNVYNVGKDSFVVASPAYDEKNNKEILHKNWVEVASICTDLWWYSIVDGDEFKRRGLRLGDWIHEVKVRPGVYKFTHFRHLNNFDDTCGKKTIFSSIEWVRPPDPLVDYKAEFMKKNFAAGQVIYHNIKQWPTLYGGPDGARRVADHIFCVIGGGGDWHPNGFVQYDPDMLEDSPEVTIPKFEGQYSWYPISKDHSAIALAARGELKLNASFMALAINILECISTYGVKAGVGRDSKEQNLINKQAEATQKYAKKLLAMLEARIRAGKA